VKRRGISGIKRGHNLQTQINAPAKNIRRTRYTFIEEEMSLGDATNLRVTYCKMRMVICLNIPSTFFTCGRNTSVSVILGR
jgi:hypothetical protein